MPNAPSPAAVNAHLQATLYGECCPQFEGVLIGKVWCGLVSAQTRRDVGVQIQSGFSYRSIPIILSSGRGRR